MSTLKQGPTVAFPPCCQCRAQPSTQHRVHPDRVGQNPNLGQGKMQERPDKLRKAQSGPSQLDPLALGLAGEWRCGNLEGEEQLSQTKQGLQMLKAST